MPYRYDDKIDLYFIFLLNKNQFYIQSNNFSDTYKLQKNIQNFNEFRVPT